jgi:uncharacterized lipoprotein
MKLILLFLVLGLAACSTASGPIRDSSDDSSHTWSDGVNHQRRW